MGNERETFFPLLATEIPHDKFLTLPERVERVSGSASKIVVLSFRGAHAQVVAVQRLKNFLRQNQATSGIMNI